MTSACRFVSQQLQITCCIYQTTKSLHIYTLKESSFIGCNEYMFESQKSNKITFILLIDSSPTTEDSGVISWPKWRVNHHRQRNLQVFLEFFSVNNLMLLLIFNEDTSLCPPVPIEHAVDTLSSSDWWSFRKHTASSLHVSYSGYVPSKCKAIISNRDSRL